MDKLGEFFSEVFETCGPWLFPLLAITLALTIISTFYRLILDSPSFSLGDLFSPLFRSIKCFFISLLLRLGIIEKVEGGEKK